MKKVLVILFAAGISLAHAASSYHVKLEKTTLINGTQVAAGDYKLELQGDKVVLKGKTSFETNATVENATRKFQYTTVGYLAGSSTDELHDISLGGTTIKLLFGSNSKASAGDR